MWKASLVDDTESAKGHQELFRQKLCSCLAYFVQVPR